MTNRDKLLKKNGLEGLEINNRIQSNHPYGDELALLRKEIHHIEQALKITPTEEFESYYNEAEAVKAMVKVTVNS